MKSMTSLVLSFLVCAFCCAQHISDFSSLAPGSQDANFHLPSTHSFQVLFDTQDFIDAGGFLPARYSGPNFDFTGYVPVEGSSKYGYLSINSEIAPGAVTILDIEYDDEQGKWLVDEAVPVDFSRVFAAANCSGTVTPWNTIITCEEYTSTELEQNTSFGWGKDVNGDGYHDVGWAVEIDPVSKVVKDQKGDLENEDKLWAMGNFKHENAVVHSNLKTVYQGADDTKGQGYLFKFVADIPQDLSSGSLYVYSGDKKNSHEWVKLKNTSQWERNNTLFQCDSLKNLVPSKATDFGGIEDVEINPIDGMIYFAVKREDSDEFTDKGVVYRFRDINPEDATGLEDFSIYAGGDAVYDGEPWGQGTDNLVFDDLGNLWVAQDGSFSKGDNNYIWLIEQGHSSSNPKVKIFAKTPGKSEPTGLTFSPDYRYIFMSIQHPRDNNSEQKDVFDRAIDFNNDVTLVIARNEHLGENLSTEDQDLMITQYYQDDLSNSNWVEVKNISGKDISAGKYFLDLFDSSSLDNIASVQPKYSEAIPAMAQDEVILFKNSANPSFPLSSHLGDARQVISNVCDFDGDDVLVITTTPGSRKYINRKDIIGSIPASEWGKDISYTKANVFSGLPDRSFDPNKWFQFTNLGEVNTAARGQNIALGTYVDGDVVWNGSAWLNNSPPDRTRIVEIDGTYQDASESLKVLDLIVNDGADLIFQDDQQGKNSSITVYRDLTVHPNASLVIGDTESLIMKRSDAIFKGSITKVEKSVFRDDIHDITYWSSPVSNQKIEEVFTDVNPDRIFYYDQTRYVNEATYWEVWVNKSTGDMIPGKGYAAEGETGTKGIHELNFTGVPNYGVIRVADVVFNNDSGNNEIKTNDFNLIGNPYTAAIDIDAFLEANIESDPVIDGTVYLWTHATAQSGGEFTDADYVTYNYMGASGTVENLDVKLNIGSAQGFFVRALKSADIVFDPSMILESSNDQFFKNENSKESSERNRIWLNLKGSDNSFKQILIGFDERASDGLDLGFDALYLKGDQTIDFYSLLGDEKLTIQGLGNLEGEKLIDLGFETSVDDLEIQIEIERVEGILNEQKVLLIDHETGLLHDLEKSTYTFNAQKKGVFNNKVSLLLNGAVLSTDDEMDENTSKVYFRDELLVIDSVKLIRELKMYDSLGRLVMQRYLSSQYFEIYMEHLSKGSLYIVELIDEQGKSFKKKVLFY